MTRYPILFVLLVLLYCSCNRKSKNEEVPEYVTEQEQVPKLKSSALVVSLNPESEELVAEWGEYQEVSEMIVQYREITKSDALLNSIELEELTRYLKDSVRIEKLDIPSVRMRLNVLHNEAKRLADMSTIPTITDSEVLEENDKVLNAYTDLNIKINDMSRQEKINRELEDFEQEKIPVEDTVSEPPPPEKKRLLQQIN
jgi:hypothetical protein